MDLAQVGTVLGAILVVAAIVGSVYVLVKVRANESAISAQREFIAVQELDIKNLKDKLTESNRDLASLRNENATLVAAVTQRAEVKALHEAEDRHHEETVSLLTAVTTALSQNTAVLLRIEEALRNGN